MRIIYIGALILMYSANSFSQHNLRLVEVPHRVILPVIAVQEDCPVAIENAKYFQGLTGGGVTTYNLRNISAKPLRRITIADSFGSEYAWADDSGKVLAPRMRLPANKDPRFAVTPLTDEIGKQLAFKNMVGMVVFMVVSVEFADGSKWDDTKTYQALVDFTDRNSDALYKCGKSDAKTVVVSGH